MLRHTRKGQLEIMGLVIVVILISLAMLFLLRFVVFKPVSDEGATFTGKKLAVNTLGAMLETTTECWDMTITELIQECVGFNKTCNGLNSNQGSCEFVEDKIEFMLEETLQKWKKSYYFMVSRSDSIKIELDDGIGCPGEKNSHFQPLPGGVSVKLDVCN